MAKPAPSPSGPFATGLVPTWVWQSLFVTGHGVASSVENVALGPLLAILAFVCSIGNVPLAVALWVGGIFFGGVTSFIFADLITLPLLLIYRRYYGTRLTLRLLAAFWVVMSAAALATQYLFTAAGLVPTTRSPVVARAGVHWNYTTVLNIFAVITLGGLYWLYRHRPRFAAVSATPKTRCAACRSKRPSPPPKRPAAGRPTTSALITANTASPRPHPDQCPHRGYRDGGPGVRHDPRYQHRPRRRPRPSHGLFLLGGLP